ncbi:hypothetical protein K438DRAFT_1979933 [Mycena galopus ATCC 62051]|nr:hypothetical protein K438DRAFT_1979933 [Mycena galopus ATCC 62051]
MELRIHGSDHGIAHPFHLHGHAFDIVQSASGPVNYVNPPRRDVIGVEKRGVIIRFGGETLVPPLVITLTGILKLGLPSYLRKCPVDDALPAVIEILCAGINSRHMLSSHNFGIGWWIGDNFEVA